MSLKKLLTFYFKFLNKFYALLWILPVRLRVGSTVGRTIRTISAHDWSRRNRPKFGIIIKHDLKKQFWQTWKVMSNDSDIIQFRIRKNDITQIELIISSNSVIWIWEWRLKLSPNLLKFEKSWKFVCPFVMAVRTPLSCMPVPEWKQIKIAFN